MIFGYIMHHPIHGQRSGKFPVSDDSYDDDYGSNITRSNAAAFI